MEVTKSGRWYLNSGTYTYTFIPIIKVKTAHKNKVKQTDLSIKEIKNNIYQLGSKLNKAQSGRQH